jgi:hypothetical protein
MGLILSTACSFSYRAEREMSERVELGEASSLWVELGDAPNRIAHGPQGENAVYIEATIEALGGSQAVATEHAEAAEIIGESLGDTLRVFPHWPADSEGLVSMKTDSLLIPAGVPMSLVAGSGHIEAGLVSGDLDIDLGAGNITVTQAEADLSLRTGSGRLEVTALPGPGEGYDVVAQSGFGPVVVDQQGAGAIFVEALAGDVEILVEDDDNLDIYVLSDGPISVDTQSLSIDEPYGEWTETLGDGSQALVVIAYAGAVSIREH